jgi:hypothetical protein
MIEPKTGYVYRLQSRNLSIGVYREIDSGRYGISRGFTGIRTKLGARYLDTEVWNEPPGRGTATPLEELGKVPNEIELTEGQDERLFAWLDKLEVHPRSGGSAAPEESLL